VKLSRIAARNKPHSTYRFRKTASNEIKYRKFAKLKNNILNKKQKGRLKTPPAGNSGARFGHLPQDRQQIEDIEGVNVKIFPLARKLENRERKSNRWKAACAFKFRFGCVFRRPWSVYRV